MSMIVMYASMHSCQYVDYMHVNIVSACFALHCLCRDHNHHHTHPLFSSSSCGPVLITIKPHLRDKPSLVVPASAVYSFWQINDINLNRRTMAEDFLIDDN